MVNEHYGPRGAEEEREIWTDLPKNYEDAALELPGDLDAPARRELRRMVGIDRHDLADAAALNRTDEPGSNATDAFGVPEFPYGTPMQNND